MKELKELFKSFDHETALLILGSTLMIFIYLYRGGDEYFAAIAGASLGSHPYFDYFRYLYLHIAALALFGVIPALAFGPGFKRSFAQNGFALGDYKFGLKFLAIGVVVTPVFLYINASSPEMMAEYPLTKLAGQSVGWFLLWQLTYLVYYVAYESFFRGSLLFPLTDKLGIWPAIFISTSLTVMQHIGKPEAETFSALIAGVFLAAVAIRTRSFLWVLLFHWYIGALTDLFCLIHIAKAAQ